MGKTSITTSDALRKIAWEAELFRDTFVESYFMGRFGGQSVEKMKQGFKMASGSDYSLSGPNDLVQIKMNLEKRAGTNSGNGDKVTFGLVNRIDPTTNPGVTTGQTLKGKEITLSWYDFSLTLARYRQAINAGTPIDWHRASFNMPDEARSALHNWGVEKLDLLCVDALNTSPTKIFYKTSSGVTSTGTAATAKSALTVADGKLTPTMISWIKAWAITGGARSYIPIRPIKIKGEDFYVLLVHPDVMFDWKENSTWQQAAREAEIRGPQNPIFLGSSFIWDHVVIHEYENVSVAADAGSGSDVPWAKCFFMGAQALCWAWGERPSIVEDTDDYQESINYAWRMTAKCGKPVFNSKDYGSLCVYLARSNVSGS